MAVAIGTEQGILIAAALLALIYLAMVLRPPSELRSWIKAGSVLLLALAAAIAGLPLLALGLGVSAFGDFALSKDGDNWFKAGVAAFALAHVVYILVFLGADFFEGRPLAMVLLASFSGSFSSRLWQRAGDLRIPVMIYAAIITAMGLVALTLPAIAGWRLVTWAAMLFILSDVLLATERFFLPEEDPQGNMLSIMVWPAYWLAQYGILAGTMVAHGLG